MRSALFLLAVAGCARTPPALELSDPVRVNAGGGRFGQSEPAIAARGSLVIVSWIDWTPPRPLVHVATSTNGGASFLPAVPVEEPAPEHSHGQADPTIAILEDGSASIAWLACGADEAGLGGRRCDVRTRRSADGRTWSPPVAATDSPLYRERPWLLTDGEDELLSWSEAGADGKWRWVVTKLGEGSASSLTLADRSTALRPSFAGGRLHALLVDRTARDPLRIELVRVEGCCARVRAPPGDSPDPCSPDPCERVESRERVTVSRPAVLLDYSYGAIAADAEGRIWTAFAIGDGHDGDFRLRRGTKQAGRLRTPGASRVGLPWIEPAGGGRFVAAWIEERADGWRVMARLLDGKAGPATAVTRDPFRFVEASLDRNIGDYLQVAISGTSAWITWSDTRDGDADIWLSRAALPGR